MGLTYILNVVEYFSEWGTDFPSSNSCCYNSFDCINWPLLKVMVYLKLEIKILFIFKTNKNSFYISVPQS